MIPTTYDYTGRKVDLEVFQTEAPPAALKRLDLSATLGGQHRRVAGIQKLVQRYLLALMTGRGSVKYEPDRGTSLMAMAAGGLLQSRTDIVQYFAFANSDAAAQLKKEDASTEGASMPDDEKYQASWLMDYLVDPSGTSLYLKIMLRSQSGSSYKFLVPIS